MTASVRESDTAAGAQPLLALFAFLLALSLILHRVWWDGFEVEGLQFAAVVAAFWVLAGPASVGRLMLLLAAVVVSVGADMPNVGDHTLLVAVIGAFVLIYALRQTAASRRLPDGGQLFVAIAPFLRASVLVLYAAAALAKLNGTFLDPAVSCAGLMAERLAWFDPSLLAAAPVAPVIWTTVLVESSLPLLLAFRRTRVAGLVLGCGFHLVLALAGNVPFTAVILALYVAFLPLDLPARVRARLAISPLGSAPEWLRRPPRGASPVLFAALLAAWLLGSALEGAAPGLTESLIDNGTRLLIVVLILAAACLALAVRTGAAGRQRSDAAVAGSARALRPIFALGVALLALNGASPYLGLKTATSFNMFSNLRTEPGYWNHALIPAGVRVFGYQDELGVVTASNDPYLRERGERGELLAAFELRRYLRRHPSAFATFDGLGAAGPELTGFDGAGSLPTAAVDKVARLQPVPRAAGPTC